MMSDDAPELAALAALLEELNPGGHPAPRRELLCGPAVIMWLRVMTPAPEPSFPWSQTPPFTGIPLIHAPDLGYGEWELQENGVPVETGRLDLPGPPDFASLLPPIALDRLPPRAPGSALDRLALSSLAFLPPRPFVISSVS